MSTAFDASGLWASGGIVSTPNDLTAFIRAYAGGSSEPVRPGRNEAGLAIFRDTTRCGVVFGHTGNFFGYTQLAVATPDGRRSLTFSITTQVNINKPEILAKLRSIQEDYV